MSDNQATLDAINYHKAQLYDLLYMARKAGLLTEDTDVAVVRVDDLKQVVDYMEFSDVGERGSVFDLATRNRFDTIIKECHADH